MTAALEGVSGQQHVSAALYPRERHGIHFTGGWVGPRDGLKGRNISSTPGFDPVSSSPVAQSLYRLSYRAHSWWLYLRKILLFLELHVSVFPRLLVNVAIQKSVGKMWIFRPSFLKHFSQPTYVLTWEWKYVNCRSQHKHCPFSDKTLQNVSSQIRSSSGKTI